VVYTALSTQQGSILVQRDLALFEDFEREAMAFLNLGPLQFEVLHRPTARQVIPVAFFISYPPVGLFEWVSFEFSIPP
jgi:hypothetical protein